MLYLEEMNNNAKAIKVLAVKYVLGHVHTPEQEDEPVTALNYNN